MCWEQELSFSAAVLFQDCFKKHWPRPLSSAVSFYHLSHMNNYVFWFYTEPVSSVIFKVYVAACFKNVPCLLYSWKKKGMIFAASLILPYIRLGSFSDSMVIPGSLPGLLYLVQWIQDEFCGFFPTCRWSKAELSSLIVIRLWQSHITLVLKNNHCVISIVSKSAPAAKKHPVSLSKWNVRCSVEWGAHLFLPERNIQGGNLWLWSRCRAVSKRLLPHVQHVKASSPAAVWLLNWLCLQPWDAVSM